MIKIKKFMLIFVTCCVACCYNNDFIINNEDGWPCIKSTLKNDKRIIIREIDYSNLLDFNENWKTYISDLPIFMFMPLHEYKTNQYFSPNIKVFEQPISPFIRGYNLSNVLNFVDKSMNDLKSCISNLDTKNSNFIVKLLLIRLYSSNNLKGKNIAHYIPKLLYMQKIIVPFHDYFIYCASSQPSLPPSITYL